MTQEEIDRIRRDKAILAEVEIIRQITPNSFTSVQHPHLLGKIIVRESLERIERLIEGDQT